MRRTRNITNAAPEKRADAILTADWHLRDNVPICRGDEFEPAQWAKVNFVKHLQKTHYCPVIHAGDLFNHWRPSPYLLGKAIEHLPDEFYTIYGNHDLPQHNFEERSKSGIHVLERAGQLSVLGKSVEYFEFPVGARKMSVIEGVHWGYTPVGIEGDFHRKILVYHIMTYQGKKPWPGITDPRAGGILRKYPEYDLILTGHNHKAFVETCQSRLLVNPGSLTRQDADQIDFQPRVYLYYADTNTCEPCFLPCKSNAVNRSHIDRSSERDDRIDAFISKLGGNYDAGLDFGANLERFFKTNNIDKEVEQKVYKAIEHD